MSDRLPDGAQVTVYHRRKRIALNGKLAEAHGRDYSTPSDMYRVMLADGTTYIAHRSDVKMRD